MRQAVYHYRIDAGTRSLAICVRKPIALGPPADLYTTDVAAVTCEDCLAAMANQVERAIQKMPCPRCHDRGAVPCRVCDAGAVFV